MRQYLDLCQTILDKGTLKEDRTGTGTRSVFGHQMRFDLQEGFPLITTKAMGGGRITGIIEELLWFIAGDTNIKTLTRKGVNIWNRDAYKNYSDTVEDPITYKEFVEAIKTDDAFADKYGDLGPVYGKQWTDWGKEHINQIDNVIESIKNNPDSRRHIVSAWNPSDIADMTLPPCHTLFQFYVADGKLSCQLYQRSGDTFLGVPYNIASYALLTMMIAQVTGYEVGDFVHTLGDAHIYTNHLEQVEEQLKRNPYELPSMVLNTDITSINDFSIQDFALNLYESHSAIKGVQSF